MRLFKHLTTRGRINFVVGKLSDSVSKLSSSVSKLGDSVGKLCGSTMVFAIIFLATIFLAITPNLKSPAHADSVDDLQEQIDELEKLKQLSEDATKPLEQELSNLESRIKSAQAGINQAKADAIELADDIEVREEELADQYALFSHRVRVRYKRARVSSPLLIFFSSEDASKLNRDLAYKRSAEQQDEQLITDIGGDLLQLERDKQKLEDDQVRLAALQVQLDNQAEFFRKEVKGAKSYQSELSGKIASLTAEQQAIIAAKTGTASTTVGDADLTGDPKSLPSYNPGFSPAFAAFSSGAPHFKGMSQYGAYGRAKSGQNFETILKAYYGDIEIREFSMPGSISTSIGSMPFEDQYLKGIAEMPSSWHMDALKAQAIAARSYALGYVGWRVGDQSVKKPICVTEQCQVYKSSKFSAGGAWHDAVNQTKGKVLVGKSSGEVVNAWYASTSGGHQLSYTSLGHTTPALWDTTSNWSNWADGAYEKIGGSPWFYKAWYKTRGGDSCGHDHPWLTEREFADILNGWVVYKSGGSDAERVSPIGSCWDGNPFSIDEMKNKANDKGGAYTSISSVRIEHSQAGTTTSVIMSTNRGELRMSGSEFKEIFNLRAPGRIALKSNLFGVERK